MMTPASLSDSGSEGESLVAHVLSLLGSGVPLSIAPFGGMSADKIHMGNLIFSQFATRIDQSHSCKVKWSVMFRGHVHPSSIQRKFAELVG